MKERPIRLYAHEVRAILEGRKTQTRRVVKPQPCSFGDVIRYTNCPYGVPGDRLWVRETWMENHHGVEADAAGHGQPLYRATCLNHPNERWRPSTHMPRWASRIDLEVTGVRVERLQDISEADCWAEGVEEVMHDYSDESQYATAKRLGLSIEDAKPLYCQLWESINGAGSWEANPWVWVIEFQRN